jgi:hypothetical protein
MTNEGKGWFREYPEHSLTGKGISLGRTKRKKVKARGNPKDNININIKQSVQQTPSLKDSLQKPIEEAIEVTPEIETEKPEAEEKKQVSTFGMPIGSPETAFTDFFGGLGGAFVGGVEQKGEAIGGGLLNIGGEAEIAGEEVLGKVEKQGETLGGTIFPSDETAKKAIDGTLETDGKKSEALNVAEEAFGADALDKQFDDMAKTRIEINYLETPDDEDEAEMLAQEERQSAGLAPISRAGEVVGEKAGEAAGYLGAKIKAGLSWAKERFRREQGREPTPDEEAQMADQIAEQAVGNGFPEEQIPTPPQPTAPIPAPAIPERQISEEEAQQIVEELEQQRLLRENGNNRK